MSTWPPATLLLRSRLRLLQVDDAKFEHARPSQSTPVAISLIGSPCTLLYYPIWKYALPQPYESLPLRVAGGEALQQRYFERAGRFVSEAMVLGDGHFLRGPVFVPALRDVLEGGVRRWNATCTSTRPGCCSMQTATAASR